MDAIHMICKRETNQGGPSEKDIPRFATVCGIPATDHEAVGRLARALPALRATAAIGRRSTPPAPPRPAPALPDDQLTADHAGATPDNWLSRERAPSAPASPWMIRPLNVAERDPRDQWWADLCADVAQAAPSRLDSLAAPPPALGTEQDGYPTSSEVAGVEDSTGNSQPWTDGQISPTSSDVA
jgi:hypothetical protein